MNKETYDAVKEAIIHFYGEKEKINSIANTHIEKQEKNKNISISKAMTQWNKGNHCDRTAKKLFWKDYRDSGRYYNKHQKPLKKEKV